MTVQSQIVHTSSKQSVTQKNQSLFELSMRIVQATSRMWKIQGTTRFRYTRNQFYGSRLFTLSVGSQKTCCSCRNTLHISNFYKDTRAKHQLRSRCKACEYQNRRASRSCFFRNMYHRAKYRFKNNHITSKIGSFDISVQDIMELYEKQHYKGYLSGIQMIECTNAQRLASNS